MGMFDEPQVPNLAPVLPQASVPAKDQAQLVPQATSQKVSPRIPSVNWIVFGLIVVTLLMGALGIALPFDSSMKTIGNEIDRVLGNSLTSLAYAACFLVLISLVGGIIIGRRSK